MLFTIITKMEDNNILAFEMGEEFDFSNYEI